MKGKIFTFVFASIMIFGMSLFAQKQPYVYDSIFDSIGSPHGITVDNTGNIWMASNGDSVGIKVLKPNKTKAFFSPIFEVTIGGQKYNVAKGCRGMTTDNEGNIVVCIGSQIIKINAKDGSGMKIKNLGGSLSKPGVDNSGRIYVTKVVGPAPLWILDSNLDSIGVVEPATGVWSRALAVTGDGKDVYIGSLWHHCVQHYHSDDLKTYALKDSLPKTFEGDTPGIDIDRKGNLWVGEQQAGRGYDKYFIYNLSTGKVDSLLGIAEEFSEDSLIFSPRGAGFSLTNDTVYISSYDGKVVQRWIKAKTTSVTEFNNVIPEKVVLHQNYPNPFNPSTVINFDLPKLSSVKLIVYNSLGQEIRVLVNESKDAGSYQTIWDGKDMHGNKVASGIYYYSLYNGTSIISKKMMLLK